MGGFYFLHHSDRSITLKYDPGELPLQQQQLSGEMSHKTKERIVSTRRVALIMHILGWQKPSGIHL